MKEKDNDDDSSNENINNTEEEINIIKEDNNMNDIKENNKSIENNEIQPLKESNQFQDKNTDNKSEKEDEEININSNNNTSINKKKLERIPLDILFQQEIPFEIDANRGCTGLVNIGNTCFMNSALQCLSNCFELTKYFLLDFYERDINQENRLGTGGQVAVIYRKLLDDLWLGDNDYINPSYFKRIFAHFVQKFSGYAQQDSNEFLIYLLDKIHEDLNTITVKPYIEMEGKKPEQTDEEVSKLWWDKHLKRENSIIVDLFHGQFKSTISCNTCHQICVSFDSYMFISLPIPSGKYEIDIKYFGYNVKNFLKMKIPITENTTVLNIIDIMKNRLNIINNNNHNHNDKSNPPKRKKRNKNKNKSNKKLYQQINISNDKIEMVLLTNKKQIYKIFKSNDYIFPYLLEGYELVAYEKDTSDKNNENIYFYLSQYYYSYIFSFFYYPRIYLFEYPLAINIDKTQKIFNIYKNIKEFLKELLPRNNQNPNNKEDDILDIDFNSNKINKDNEKNCGFTIYLNTYIPNKNSSLCNSIFSSGYAINHPLLEKYSSTENYSNIKRQLNLDELNLSLTLDINILFNLDKSKLPSLNNFINKKLSLNVGKDINLYDCINLFNSEEILDGDNEWYCNKCKRHVEAVKKMDIYKSPYYLIFQLKRFKQDNDGSSIFSIFNSSKNTTFIDFPVTDLDLSKYILSESNQGAKYDLIGIINHYGGESFGHYTAYCLNEGKWREYNDEYVSEIKQSNIVTSAAYVLFYKRRDEN